MWQAVWLTGYGWLAHIRVLCAALRRSGPDPRMFATRDRARRAHAMCALGGLLSSQRTRFYRVCMPARERRCSQSGSIQQAWKVRQSLQQRPATREYRAFLAEPATAGVRKKKADATCTPMQNMVM